MMTSALTFAAVIAACSAISWMLSRRAGHRCCADRDSCLQLIDAALTLIQLLQKHRGLGAQQSSTAATQRAQIARDIDSRWRDWASQMKELNYLQRHWSRLKQNPGDFDGHSFIIKHLLGFIEALSLHIDAAAQTSQLSLAQRCRALEDLARLRGLSARAAQFPQCPIELKVPLKYLCENLRTADLQSNAATIQAALGEINEHLLEAQHTSISAARCFDILTPIIDRALDELRTSVNQLRQQYSLPAHGGFSAPR